MGNGGKVCRFLVQKWSEDQKKSGVFAVVGSRRRRVEVGDGWVGIHSWLDLK